MLQYKLKELRRREGITQAELARALDVSVGAVGNWESGKRTPDIRTLHRIADCFSVTVDYLAGLSDAGLATDMEFSVCCPDDGMIGAGIRTGDTVYIRRQDAVEDGRIGAVLIGGEVLLRRIYRYGEYLVLQADNPAWGPMVFPAGAGNPVHVLGMAVSFVGVLS